MDMYERIGCPGKPPVGGNAAGNIRRRRQLGDKKERRLVDDKG